MKHLSLSWSALTLGLALSIPGSAWSADPVLGTTKFSQRCAACHSVASTASVDRGRNSPAMIQNAIATVGAMSSLSSLSSTDLEDIAAYLGNAPSSLSFSQTTVGQTGSAQVVTVRASRIAALTSLSASVSGDYVLQGGTCGATLAAGSSCTIGVAFAPAAAGSRSGSLSISHSGLSTAVPIGLSGTGAATAQATVALDASALAFGNQAVGVASSARTVTVSNTGAAGLSFSSIGVSGAAAADFATSGSCAVGTAVAAGATCSVSVRFTPAATGSRAATLTLASNASNGSASVALSGTGQAAATPAVSLSPAALAFGSVAVGSSATAQSVTLLNSGTGPLNLQSVQASGPFTASHACGSSLAAAASCSISVVFTPTGAGAATGSLSVASDASGSPHAVPLSGTGVLAGTGILQWSDSGPLDFGSVAVGADASPQTLTLSNTGTASATLSTLTLAGANAADFRIDTASTCAVGQALAAGASCGLTLGFSPSAAGARAATLTLATDNASAPEVLALGGTGSIAAAPALVLSATALNFVAPVGGSADAQPLTLANPGTADLHVSALTLGSARFALSSPASQGCGTAPFTLAPGASCTVELQWLGAPGDAAETTALSVLSEVQPAAVVELQGEGAAAQASNTGGGGCTLGAGTDAVDPTLLALALAAAALAWRRRRAL